MPRQTTVTCTEGVWTQLTDADVTAMTFTVTDPGAVVMVLATAGAVAPTDTDGAIPYRYGEGERNVDLADLFPGVTSANRVYALSTTGNARVVASHV